MTTREFYVAICAIENLSEDIRSKAEELLNKHDASLEKKRNTPTKTQIANEPLMAQLMEVLGSKSMTASELGEAMELSTPKISALARTLCERHMLKKEDTKIKGKGTVKIYTAMTAEERAAAEEAAAAAAAETADAE